MIFKMSGRDIFKVKLLLVFVKINFNYILKIKVLKFNDKINI